jgi:flavin-dependent dehydrogenase
MLDVLIVGAGPAGAVAAVVLARAGVRVRIVDRATFPRGKLCGDTVNPGALARLQALGLAADLEVRGLPVAGMLVTGERGVAIEGRYPDGVVGRAIVRRDLDWLLLRGAIDAGCQFEAGVSVRGAVVTDDKAGRAVSGVTIGRTAGETLAARSRSPPTGVTPRSRSASAWRVTLDAPAAGRSAPITRIS